MQPASFEFNSGEILNINKPTGWTSFDLVRTIRNHLRIKKVGHAGTLDPFATGVLLILTGKATKKSLELTGLEKEYLAEIEFGTETDTHDVDGKVIRQCEELPGYDEGRIRDCLQEFVGEIEQVPPAYSAIKFKGKPLYKYARKGIAVELKPRKVTVKSARLVDANWPLIKIEVICSKGTYIRSLARDLGTKLGTGAFLRSLVRTRIGSYQLKDSYNISDFLKMGEVSTANEGC